MMRWQRGYMEKKIITKKMGSSYHQQLMLSMAQKVLVSACLLGDPVRYDGGTKASFSPILGRWLSEGRVVKFCPEVAGGLPIPRPPSEIRPDGHVVMKTGVDVSAEFSRGAEEAVRVAKEAGIKVAVMKEGSPSCGSSFVYDGWHILLHEILFYTTRYVLKNACAWRARHGRTSSAPSRSACIFRESIGRSRCSSATTSTQHDLVKSRPYFASIFLRRGTGMTPLSPSGGGPPSWTPPSESCFVHFREP